MYSTNTNTAGVGWFFIFRNNYIVWDLVLYGINSHVCLPSLRLRLKDHFIQNLQSEIQCESKCYIYKYLDENFCLQFYFEKFIRKKY